MLLLSWLKVWMLLNGDIPQDDVPAHKLCRLADASGVPEVKRALVVDAGDILLRRCYAASA